MGLLSLDTPPTSFFLSSGASEGYTRLNAFDCALLNAGVGNTNLIKISSILPPGVRLIEPAALQPGAFIPIAYASIMSDTPHQMIAAAVAAAVPADPSLPGVIMEYSSTGHAEDALMIVRAMVEEAMRYRNFEIKEILSASVEHRVESVGAAFACVVLHR